MPHVLDFFTAGCPLCNGFETQIELGQCGPCRLRIRDVRKPAARAAMRRYGIRVVPTLVVDGKIRVEGPLNEPWVCGDAFYHMLEKRFPLANARLATRSGTKRAP